MPPGAVHNYVHMMEIAAEFWGAQGTGSRAALTPFSIREPSAGHSGRPVTSGAFPSAGVGCRSGMRVKRGRRGKLRGRAASFGDGERERRETYGKRVTLPHTSQAPRGIGVGQAHCCRGSPRWQGGAWQLRHSSGKFAARLPPPPAVPAASLAPRRQVGGPPWPPPLAGAPHSAPSSPLGCAFLLPGRGWCRQWPGVRLHPSGGEATGSEGPAQRRWQLGARWAPQPLSRRGSGWKAGSPGDDVARDAQQPPPLPPAGLTRRRAGEETSARSLSRRQRSPRTAARRGWDGTRRGAAGVAGPSSRRSQPGPTPPRACHSTATVCSKRHPWAFPHRCAFCASSGRPVSVRRWAPFLHEVPGRCFTVWG